MNATDMRNMTGADVQKAISGNREAMSALAAMNWGELGSYIQKQLTMRGVTATTWKNQTGAEASKAILEKGGLGGAQWSDLPNAVKRALQSSGHAEFSERGWQFTRSRI